MSENSWWDDLSNSAKTFEKVVWPEVEKFLHGRIEHVEAVTNDGFKQCLDQYSGIDAWHVLDSTGVIRGIASRIQARPVSYYGAFPYNTFTVRKSRDSGTRTEYVKRREAIADNEGYLYPHFTIQAYVEKWVEGPLLSLGIARTSDIIYKIEAWQIDGCPVRNDIYVRGNKDGQSDFYVLEWTPDIIEYQFGLIVPPDK